MDDYEQLKIDLHAIVDEIIARGKVKELKEALNNLRYDGEVLEEIEG